GRRTPGQTGGPKSPRSRPLRDPTPVSQTADLPIPSCACARERFVETLVEIRGLLWRLKHSPFVRRQALRAHRVPRHQLPPEFGRNGSKQRRAARLPPPPGLHTELVRGVIEEHALLPRRGVEYGKAVGEAAEPDIAPVRGPAHPPARRPVRLLSRG